MSLKEKIHESQKEISPASVAVSTKLCEDLLIIMLNADHSKTNSFIKYF